MATNLRQIRRLVTPPTLLSEIEGYTALGMKAEALALCRRALQLERPDGKLLSAVIESVDRLAIQKRRWMPALEATYARLRLRDQRQARFPLLFLESSLRRSVQVLQLAPRRYRGELAWLELLFVAAAAFATREWHILKAISRRLRRAAQSVLDEEIRAWMEDLSTKAERAEKRVATRS